MKQGIVSQKKHVACVSLYTLFIIRNSYIRLCTSVYPQGRCTCIVSNNCPSLSKPNMCTICLLKWQCCVYRKAKHVIIRFSYVKRSSAVE
jgi:hypothetical protein